MNFHEIDCQGKFYIEVLDSLPAWTSADVRRIIYVTSNDMMYYASSVRWEPFYTPYTTLNNKLVDYTLTTSDLKQGFSNKLATSTIIFSLPTITSLTLGYSYIFYKRSTYELHIKAASGDYIMDSSSGGYIINDTTETNASLYLESTDDTLWTISGGNGTWRTT